MRILIIENDATINNTLVAALKKHNYANDVVESIKDAEYYLDFRQYDLTLINETLLEGCSDDFIDDIKQNSPKMAVIVISAQGDNTSEIRALRAGASDYIRKSCDLGVLMARVEVNLRSKGSKIIKIKGLVIIPDEPQITYKEQGIPLTGKPFEVLAYLARHRDEVISKEHLLAALWSAPELVTPQVIDVAIHQIRQKLDKPFGITTIETISFRGYRFIFPKEAE